jgi:serine/threonine protein kinase
MAPEQARHIREIDIRADIFSLGVIAFELLTGRLPLPGKTVIEKLMVRASEDAPPVSEFREEVPREVEAIVRGMLARKVEDRYQLPSHVASAIAPYSFAAADADPTTEDSVAITAMATVERATEAEDEASPFDDFLHQIAKAPPSQVSRDRNPKGKVAEVSRPPREGKQRDRSGNVGPRLDGSLWNRFLDQNLYLILGGAAIVALTILFLILG